VERPICFPGREKQGRFSRRLQGRINAVERVEVASIKTISHHDRPIDLHVERRVSAGPSPATTGAAHISVMIDES
jgi:hypothetical protein